MRLHNLRAYLLSLSKLFDLSIRLSEVLGNPSDIVELIAIGALLVPILHLLVVAVKAYLREVTVRMRERCYTYCVFAVARVEVHLFLVKLIVANVAACPSLAV